MVFRDYWLNACSTFIHILEHPFKLAKSHPFVSRTTKPCCPEVTAHKCIEKCKSEANLVYCRVHTTDECEHRVKSL